MSKILISIISHSQQSLVQQLLISIEQFLIPGNHEVQIVVTENCNEQINFEQIKFPTKKLQNLYRKGFGANHNDAFIKTQSDYFFIVNPDIILNKPFDLTAFINYMETENVSISSPKIESKYGEICDFKRADLTPLNLINRRLFKRENPNYKWLAGMFLIVNSKDFRALTGFDTSFFMYVEDCDLCMRAIEKGMKVLPFESISVVHDEQRASRNKFRFFLWHFSSLIKYWYKHSRRLIFFG